MRPHSRDRGVATPVPTTYDNKGFTIAIGLFALFLAVYAVMQSPLFQLKAVELAGAERLSLEDVLAAGKLELGDNLFSINLRELRRSLEQIPLIEEAR